MTYLNSISNKIYMYRTSHLSGLQGFISLDCTRGKFPFLFQRDMLLPATQTPKKCDRHSIKRTSDLHFLL